MTIPTQSTSLRQTFNQEAELYDKARPRYPVALFDALINATDLSSDAKLLEIGPGTGQATKPLAEHGYDITAIELGDDLAEVARRELRQYSNVEVVAGAFEDANLPADTFDLVYAATAFHWVKKEVRFTKPHFFLKQGGHLAIIHTNHVSNEQGDVFFHASQLIYDKYHSRGDDEPHLPESSDLKPTELDPGLFTLTHFELFPMVVTYTTQEYADLLNTYSPTLSLPEDERADFLRDIRKLIDNQFNGTIQKVFVMSLTIARRVKD